MKKVNVLVTGCGGDIGQSIGKILNESVLIKNLYGCDISDKNAGRFIFSNFFVGLPCNDSEYISSLRTFIVDKDIDIVIPVSEPELRYFAVKKIRKLNNASILMASDCAIEVGFDKYLTAKFLEEKKLPFPLTQIIDQVEVVEKFPVILKSRNGSGSSSVHVVRESESFNYLKKKHSDFIVQEYLGDSLGEYTCGLFRSSKGIVRTIAFRRELMGGFSGYGEVVVNTEINNLLFSLAEHFQLVGSINVQLRLTPKGPVVFEINPRFSSTVRFRDLLGFKDLQWALEDQMGLDISDYPTVSSGKMFFKGFNEYIL